MGTNLAYDMLCELACLDNGPPTPAIRTAGGVYFTEGVTHTDVVVIIIANPTVFGSIVAASGTAEEDLPDPSPSSPPLLGRRTMRTMGINNSFRNSCIRILLPPLPCRRDPKLLQ